MIFSQRFNDFFSSNLH